MKKEIGIVMGILMIGIASALYTVRDLTFETTVEEPFEILWLSDLHFGGGNCYNEEIECSEWYPSGEVFHWTEPPETIERTAYPGDYVCYCFRVSSESMTPIDLQLDIESDDNVEFTAQHGNIMTLSGDSIPVYFWIKMEVPTDSIPGTYNIDVNFNRV